MPVSQGAINQFFSAARKPKSNVDAAPTDSAVKRKAEVDLEAPQSKPLKLSSEVLKAEEEGATDVVDESAPVVTVGGIPVNEGESIPYRSLTNTFEKVEATTKRLEINSICSEFFLDVLRVQPAELVTVTYLFINRLGPDYEGLELGLGESLIMKALAEATGRTMAQVKADYHKVGDLGTVALNSRRNQPTMFNPKPLTVSEVFKSLTQIAHSTGHSSQNKKIGIIKRLLTACKGTEPKFLVRSLEGKLRIGMAEKSVLTALAQAFVTWEAEKDNKKPKADSITRGDEIVKDVFSQMPNYEIIINHLIADGVEKLPETCKISAGVPLKPMLAKPTKSITDILDRFQGEEFTCEYKYDGERAQVHATSDGKVHVYSRSMEDMSQRYPDIVSIVPKLFGSAHKSFILDCEAVAWDREQRKILPFQVLSTRKRKDVEEGSIKVRVHLYAFDVLFFDGEPLLQKSLVERREVLRANFREIEGEFAYAKSMNSDNIEDIQQFLDQSVKDSCEGLMVKMLNGSESGYEPSKRSRNWLKLKKDYLNGVGDSLDLVVLGAYYGRGKRTNVYGGFLLGCYNAETEEYETVCKIGTGFSEENLEEFHKQLSQTVLSAAKPYFAYDSSAAPDVWFEPTTVWEILTADLSLSPVYKAGIQELGKGVSLRFPRFIRIRDDKKPEDATSSEQIVHFYQRQASTS